VEQAKKQDAVTSAEIADLSTVKTARGFFWFVAQGSLLKGPYSTTELKKLVDKKEISEKFFAWRDGYHEWRPIYGIEDFKVDKAEDLVYPSVPVPGMHTPAVNPLPAKEVHDPHKVPIYKVRFNRSRWSDLKKTEVVLLFLTSLVFTLSIVSMAFRYFEKEWDVVWGKRVSSILYNVGQAPDALPSYLLGPLQSAPGLQHQEQHFVALEAEGDINRFDPMKFEGHTLESEIPAANFENLNWDKSHTYIRRMKVQGYVDLKNPAVLHVEMPGSPFEPLLSPRNLSK